MTQLILASQSPRRKQLLQQLGLNIRCQPVDIDETPELSESPLGYCERLALEKAITGLKQSQTDLPVLGSDTIVVLDNELLGKPKDEEDAFQTLKKLSGRAHLVITSVAVTSYDQTVTKSSISEVKFCSITDAEIKRYIATGEPMDKAGSYAIQGLASVWVEHINGSYSGIMGLPTFETALVLKNFNINIL